MLLLPKTRIVWQLTLLVLLGAGAALADEPAPLTEARRLLSTGRYAEATAAFEALTDQPLTAALGLAQCNMAVGQYGAADLIFRSAIEGHPEAAELIGQRAWLAFRRGDHEAAGQLSREALRIDGNQFVARWVAAELHRTSGRLDEAEAAYGWFIDFYNGRDNFQPDELIWIGRAAAQYARWKRNSQQFRFLINTLLPAALETDPRYWPAHLEAAHLLMEKYNQADAKAELDKALAINPNAAEIYEARAELALQNFDLRAARASIERALEINPQSLAALRLQADYLMADLQPSAAIEVLQAARKINPVDQPTLGRWAAAYGAVHGVDQVDNQDSPLATTIAAVTARNEHCGEFFMAMGDSFDRMRKYPAAARFYEEAQRRMPRLLYVRGQLGLLWMRLGDEARGAELLEESFAMDPFNVRVKNMLEVLDVLRDYAVLETDHFVIRFDRGRDQILARYAARYLEDEVYPEVVATMGYEPPEKTLLEFFSRAKNHSGHSWFSARMVGLPFIGTVGACAGKVVAIASPNDMPQKFNWARVLKHEFVHVVNLQQTDFNIPHWYTEALAVRAEKMPRPPEWLDILARRARADSLFDLGNINLGFIRPRDADDWTLAYCQAELYAEFMADRFGDEALAQMLAAYADNLNTTQAIQRCFGIGIAEFETGYRQYIDRLVANVPVPPAAASHSFAALLRAAAAAPEDADALAALAVAYIDRGDFASARKYAAAAQQIAPDHQLAAYAIARVYLSIGDATTAVTILQTAVDEDDPQSDALALLAGLYLKAERFEDAERLYRNGAERYPHADRWLKSLARVHLQSGDDERLAETLEQLATIDYDNPLYAKKLVQLSVAAKRFDRAVQWANRALQIDVMDAEVHALLAMTLTWQQQYDRAADQWTTAIELSPRQNDWRHQLVDVLVQAERTTAAIEHLEMILEFNPNDPRAVERLNELQRAATQEPSSD